MKFAYILAVVGGDTQLLTDLIKTYGCKDLFKN